MNKSEIANVLVKEGFGQQEADTYDSYVQSLINERDWKKPGKPKKNQWAEKVTLEKWLGWFRRVNSEGLIFDGKNITINTHGISYNWVAYKNKMFITYPDTKIDVALVFKGDTFSFTKDEGIVSYKHEIANPFKQEDSELEGAYCVIKNKRGEFLTTLGVADINKHRAVAKTKAIWDAWFKEMVLKTVVKKACSQHFRDIYQKIENEDNEQYNLDQVVGNPDLEADLLKNATAAA